MVAVPQSEQSLLKLSLGKPASSEHHADPLVDVVDVVQRIRLE